jgi:hypothetical protein
MLKETIVALDLCQQLSESFDLISTSTYNELRAYNNVHKNSYNDNYTQEETCFSFRQDVTNKIVDIQDGDT